MSKLVKMKSFITSLFGIKEYRLNSEGKLDISVENYARLTENYGAEFINRFEKMLGEEAASLKPNANDIVSQLNNGTKQAKTDMNLTLLCALLSVQAISIIDGKATLSEEQLGKIEAGLKKLEDDKAAAVTESATAKTAKETAEGALSVAKTELATAKAVKETAEGALSAAVTAMDDLDTTVKAAADPKAKVEAIRKKLAEKPGAAATGIQNKTDNGHKAIEGADPVTAYAQGIV